MAESFIDGLLDEMKSHFVVSMSTTFYPREDFPTDLMLVTADGIVFAVHRRILLKSSNSFGGLLMDNEEVTSSVAVQEQSTIFNFFLHLLYGYNPAQYKPSIEEISAMLDCLPKYGVYADSSIVQGTPMYEVILGFSLSSPLDTFAMVCHHHLEQLAVEISRKLVDVELHNLTDEQCLLMGPIYLRRLIFLHLGRTERLKALLKEPPAGHSPNKHCDEVDMKRFLQAKWKQAASSLLWDLGPNTSVSLIRSALTLCIEHLPCAECITSTKERIRQIIVEWTTVKSTI